MKIKRRETNAEVPMVGMGDIVFNLLIFFVILARAQDDSHLKWNPADTQEVENVGHARVSVVIDINNKLYLNGKEVGIAQLAQGIKDQLGDAPAGERTVLCKIDKEAQAQRFEPVIEAVSEAGGDLVHVLEEDRETKGK